MWVFGTGNVLLCGRFLVYYEIATIKNSLIHNSKKMTEQELSGVLSVIKNTDNQEQATALLKLASEAIAFQTLQKVPQKIKRSDEAGKKPQTSVKVKFTPKEFNDMPQKYRKLFKYGTVVATVAKKKNGVYEVRCQINHIRYYGCSKRLELAKLKFIEDLHREKEPKKSVTVVLEPVIEDAPLMTNDYFYSWINEVKKPTIKANTYNGYNNLYDCHLKTYFKGMTLKDVTTKYVQVKINELIVGKHFRTAKKIKTMLGDMFKFAVNNGDIPNNPLANVIVPKYDENHGEAITLEEEKHLVDFLIESRDKYVQAYVFLIYTGMRIGELATAKLENGWISLTSEKVRFGLKDKIRHIPVSPMLTKVLPYIDVQLITSIKRDALIKHIKTYLPDRTTKDLRHTFITRCRECKIQREITSVWSGHISDNSMTTKVYTHLESNKELQLEEIALFNYELE